MSDFNAKAASCTFHVRDVRALRRALEGLSIVIHPATRNGDPNHVYLESEQDKGCWPNERFDEERGEVVEVNLLALIARHLKPGEVAVLKEAGLGEGQLHRGEGQRRERSRRDRDRRLP